ncbi:MAG: hypothetical protein M3P83_11280, partial [Actinomycetota bacterium]|nr:hypothetical protein [Actinomycetota bacterium]
MTRPDQLRRTPHRRPRLSAAAPADVLPVARVLVDTPLAHLDRPFDYLVPADLAADVVPGCRVKVRFSGQEVPGFVLERSERSSHDGRLEPLRRVVSPQVVLTPEVLRLCREVGNRYAGTVNDVLRLAVPTRHARVEREQPAPAPAAPVADLEGLGSDAWSQVDGAGFVADLRAGSSPRAVWTACPGVPWERSLLEAAAPTVAHGRGVLVCVPDARDVARVTAAFAQSPLADVTVTLTADLGPARRYRAFLRTLRGDARVVVGTRAVVFAPVQRLGLAAIWDDGDD